MQVDKGHYLGMVSIRDTVRGISPRRLAPHSLNFSSLPLPVRAQSRSIFGPGSLMRSQLHLYSLDASFPDESGSSRTQTMRDLMCIISISIMMRKVADCCRYRRVAKQKPALRRSGRWWWSTRRRSASCKNTSRARTEGVVCQRDLPQASDLLLGFYSCTPVWRTGPQAA